jgi:hypothetical protein
LPINCGLKTDRVFEWLKARWKILPLENRKLCPENDHLNIGPPGI